MRIVHWLKHNNRMVLLWELGNVCTELAKDPYFDVEVRMMFERIADKADELAFVEGGGSVKDK